MGSIRQVRAWPCLCLRSRLAKLNLDEIHPSLHLHSSPLHLQLTRVVWLPPNLVEKFDDKGYLNGVIRSHHQQHVNEKLPMPCAWTVSADQDLDALLRESIVAKPVRGRGSHGAKVCYVTGEFTDSSNLPV
ncbi:hypothetical protein ASPZODRAFT_1206252 [Penicilliopsis zonata CBS 506.65]|uniref:Uncharacterized protein n=1 Tax=Penicilliopsis zonata CBS 506.65 TaxID=1073090 RepID=A0A1L9S7A7_9EURO|nr:hypothetical protein ASPZODRAFT_1206252 [Penicilliopsis zonata CBS 506.65]OJJ43039.1 hypothetical protein ASPZODRAFT_1206252 [Penicilliopsis zonata CBS 506.65]